MLEEGAMLRQGVFLLVFLAALQLTVQQTDHQQHRSERNYGMRNHNYYSDYRNSYIHPACIYIIIPILYIDGK